MSWGTGKICALPVGKTIRNVEGSTDDPTIYGEPSNWLALWRKKTGWNDTVNGKITCCVCGRKDGWKAGSWSSPHCMIGGHIVLGSGADKEGRAASEQAWDLQGGNRVFIAPICSYCNGQSGDMTVNALNKIVQLCGFLEDSNIENELMVEMENEGKDPYGKDRNEFWTRVQNYQDEIAEKVASQSQLDSWDSTYLSISAAALPSAPSGASASSSSASHRNRSRTPKSGVWHDYSSSGYQYY